MLVDVKDAPGFIKDTESGAIINTDDESYKMFLAQRENAKKNKDMCKKLNDLENEFREIKQLLLQIVNRNN